MSDDASSERYTQQTTEQFVALGRFVQAFEMVVYAIRFTCSRLLNPTNRLQQILYDVILNHQVMTAKPLVDIMCALYSEIIKERIDLSQVDKEIISEILKQISKEFEALYSKRNSILHGTWFVGWGPVGSDDFSKLISMKYKVTNKGIERAALPKSIEEFDKLIEKCNKLHDLIFRLMGVFIMSGPHRLSANFRKVGDVWIEGKATEQP